MFIFKYNLKKIKKFRLISSKDKIGIHAMFLLSYLVIAPMRHNDEIIRVQQ